MSKILDKLIEYPFIKLFNLLKDEFPKDSDIIDFSIGEPRHPLPDIFYETLNKNQHLWNKYPPVNGTEEYRATVVDWLKKRYKLRNNFLNPDLHVLPLSGTREGLYSLTQFLIETRPSNKKNVGMPNPFYQTYYAAAIMSNSEPILFSSHPSNHYLPNLNEFNDDICNKLALLFICSPTNPQGTFANYSYIKNIIMLAKKYNFFVAFDECYSELYLNKPPTGALEVCNEENFSLDNVLIFNSLSKRSSAAGIRSGFIVGDENIIKNFSRVRSFSCAGVPLPIVNASIALLKDESHVVANRNLYRDKFLVGERILGDYPGFTLPDGAIYLWINVEDGESIAKKLWSKAAIKVLPGSFLAVPDRNHKNPAQQYIRLAMVQDLESTRTGIERIKEVLLSERKKVGLTIHNDIESSFQTHPSAEVILNILYATRDSEALRLAYELKLFSIIYHCKKKTLMEIAQELQLTVRSAQALLSICTSMGLLIFENNFYSLSKIAEDFLLPDSPFYCGDILNANISNATINDYDAFKKAIFSNNSIVYKDEKIFEEHEHNVIAATFFTKTMHNKSLYAATFWPKVVDLNNKESFLDIGGGSGAHSIGVVSQWPKMLATLYDRPHVCRVAREYCSKSQYADRINILIGDMWQDTLPEADIHFYSDIFHDWPLEKVQILVEKSYKSLPVGGQIMVHEMLFNDQKSGPHTVARYNLLMLLFTEGQQLSMFELYSILQAAGFKDIDTKPTGLGDWSITVGIKRNG